MLSFLAFIFALSFLAFYFKRFLLASFSSQATENNKKKNNHREKKNAKKGGSLPSNSYSALSLLVSAFGLMFLPFHFKHFLLGIFFFSSRRKERKTQNKIIEKKKNAKKRGKLPFFSYFCIWDEAFLSLFPLHIPSMLSSPPSLSFVSHVFLKLCVTQA
jgi:hypothetical protein